MALSNPPGAGAVAMSAQEKRHFGALERKIAAGLQTFREVGNALLEIRDGRLYRDTHSTFENYCVERWGMNRSRAYQLIDSARVVKALGEPDEIVNEAQARELASLSVDDAKKVWKQVEATVEETHQPLTAGLIRQVKGEIIEPNGGVPSADEPTLTDRLVQDMSRLGATYTRWVESKPEPIEKRRVTTAKKTLIGVLT